MALRISFVRRSSGYHARRKRLTTSERRWTAGRPASTRDGCSGSTQTTTALAANARTQAGDEKKKSIQNNAHLRRKTRHSPPRHHGHLPTGIGYAFHQKPPRFKTPQPPTASVSHIQNTPRYTSSALFRRGYSNDDHINP
ncbi:hypothetical protein MRX96_016161 [Rhipicephalus microplus]